MPTHRQQHDADKRDAGDVLVDVFLTQEVDRKNDDQHTANVSHPPGMRRMRCENETCDDDDGANGSSDNISSRYFPQTVFAKHRIDNQENKIDMDAGNIAATIKGEEKEENA